MICREGIVFAEPGYQMPISEEIFCLSFVDQLFGLRGVPIGAVVFDQEQVADQFNCDVTAPLTT